MSARPIDVDSGNKSSFDDDLCYSGCDNPLTPGYDGEPNEHIGTSMWAFPEESTSIKRRTRPTWQLIEDYKEGMRLRRMLEEIDFDPFVEN